MVSRLLLAVLCVSLGTALAHREGHRSTPLSSLAIGGDILFANNAERPWSVFALSSVVAHNPFGSFEIKLFPNERNASFDLLLKKKQAPGRWFDKPAHPGGDMETRHKRHEEGRKTWARDENVVARTKGGDVLSIQMKDIEAKDHILIVRGSGSFELQACFKNCKPICQDDCASNGLCNVNTGMCECADEPMDLAKDLPFSDKFDPLGNKKEDKAECSITYKETPLPTPTPEPVPEPTPAPLPPSVDTGSIGGDSHDQVPHHAGDNSESAPEASEEEEDSDDGDGLPLFFISFVATFVVMLGCMTCCYKSCIASRLKRRTCSRYNRLPIVNKVQLSCDHDDGVVSRQPRIILFFFFFFFSRTHLLNISIYSTYLSIYATTLCLFIHFGSEHHVGRVCRCWWWDGRGDRRGLEGRREREHALLHHGLGEGHHHGGEGIGNTTSSMRVGIEVVGGRLAREGHHDRHGGDGVMDPVLHRGHAGGRGGNGGGLGGENILILVHDG
eukprot:TRINITY_DN44_c0_g1_i4.p1 TRINITY_DN44_c0_g1~~TRINITY_DN44_c0_g1_i4.p1  ORF type:complete len:501 (-),score=92.58 TRINITY_DN44_c0_g1_i4:170-1672(-)